MTVESEFAFDAAEHRRASAAVLRLLPLRWYGPGIAVAVLIFASVPILRSWGEYPASTLVASALPWLIISVLFAFLMPITIRLSVRKLLKVDPSIRGTQRRALDALGYHSAGNGVTLDLPWHAMARCVETEEFFLFFYTKQLAYYLGKSRLSAVQCAEVRSLIAAHAPVAA